MSSAQNATSYLRAAADSTATTRRHAAHGPLLPAWLAGCLLPGLLLLVWYGIGAAGLVRPSLLPPPAKVLQTLADMAATGELLWHLRATLSRIAVGFAFGAGLAVPLGAACGLWRPVGNLLDPTVQMLRSVPSLAWVPLFILWLGIGEISKVTLIALGVFLPVYLNMMTAVGQVDRKLVEAGRAYRLRGARLIARVILPASLPGLFVGLRSGLGLGWMFVVAAEIMGASEGLGFLMVDGQSTGRPDLIIGALLLFAVCGKLSDMLLASLGRVVLSWQDTVGTATS